MDPVLDLLVQALGEAEGRRVWGTFRLAQTAVEAQRQAQQQAEQQQAPADRPPNAEGGE